MSEIMPKKAICPKCNKVMRYEGTQSTLVGYISTNGHNHDDNCKTRTYLCENSHSMIVSKRNKCNICDWKGILECFCCDDIKLEEWPEEV